MQRRTVMARQHRVCWWCSHSIPGQPQPRTCHLVHLYILKIGGYGEHQYPPGSRLSAGHLSVSGRNGASACVTYRPGQADTVGDTLPVELAPATPKVPEVRPRHHCSRSLASVILAFPFSSSSTCKYCVCSHGCFTYCTAPQVLIQNTYRTEPIVLSLFWFALVSLFPFKT